MPRTGVQPIHVAAVGADVDHPARVGRRAVHLGAEIDAPAQPRMGAPPHVERVEVVIPGAEVEDPVHEQRRRLDRARLVTPEDLAAVEQDAAMLRTEQDRDDEPLL